MDKLPRRVSDVLHVTNINNYLVPFEGRLPLPMKMPGCSNLFIATFSTKEKLEAFCKEYGLEYESIKKIDEQFEFLKSFESCFRVMVDPYKHEDGLLRFEEVQLPLL